MEKQKLRLGTVAFSPKGKWNAETEYKRLNVVHYLASSYYAKKDNVGQTPSLDSEYWGLLVEGGDVVNNPDEEDITTEVVNDEHVLKLADRDYRPDQFSGKGYKILRKNLKRINLAVTKITVNKIPTADGEISITINNVDTHVTIAKDTQNTTALVATAISEALIPEHEDYDVEVADNVVTLTRKHSGEVEASAFDVTTTGMTLDIEDSVKTVTRNLITPVMVNKPNTIYEIRYDFDLDGQTIEVPENCTLKFEGGSLGNGEMLFNYTYIKEVPCSIVSIKVKGTILNHKINVSTFGLLPDRADIDSAKILYNIEELKGILFFPCGVYYFDEYFCDKSNVSIEGKLSNIDGETVFSPFRENQNYIMKFGGEKYECNVGKKVKNICINGILFQANGEKFTAFNNYQYGLLMLEFVETGYFDLHFKNSSNIVPLYIGYCYEMKFKNLTCYRNIVKSDIPVILFAGIPNPTDRDVSATVIDTLSAEGIGGPIIKTVQRASVSELIINNLLYEAAPQWMGDNIKLINNDSRYFFNIRSNNPFSREDYDSCKKIPLLDLNAYFYCIINNISINSLGISKWRNILDADDTEQSPVWKTNTFINYSGYQKVIINNAKFWYSPYIGISFKDNVYTKVLKINNLLSSSEFSNKTVSYNSNSIGLICNNIDYALIYIDNDVCSIFDIPNIEYRLYYDMDLFKLLGIMSFDGKKVIKIGKDKISKYNVNFGNLVLSTESLNVFSRYLSADSDCIMKLSFSSVGQLTGYQQVFTVKYYSDEMNEVSEETFTTNHTAREFTEAIIPIKKGIFQLGIKNNISIYINYIKL